LSELSADEINTMLGFLGVAGATVAHYWALTEIGDL
jgi:hypothetical protein